METLVDQLKSTYAGKRILVTGHNGFKGSWLVALLNHLGAEVHGISLGIAENSPFQSFHLSGSHANHVQDISDFKNLDNLIKVINPELVFHLAAQALVLDSYVRPRETFEVNVQGTANVLDSTIGTRSLGVIVSTTDKVYKNNNGGIHFVETDELWGHDPYSLSKTGAELVVSAWRNLSTSENWKLVTVRAGNVIGPGDRSMNRLMPDLIRGFHGGTPVTIRNPGSIRPWQYVIDPLIGYLIVGGRILNFLPVSNSYNFGPAPSQFASVNDLVDLFKSRTLILTQIIQDESGKESEVLKLNSELAKDELFWESNTDLSECIDYIIKFESSDISSSSMYSHIEEFLLKLG
jgi:CDP-glucose 4,6-dehydratase